MPRRTKYYSYDDRFKATAVELGALPGIHALRSMRFFPGSEYRVTTKMIAAVAVRFFVLAWYLPEHAIYPRWPQLRDQVRRLA